MSKVVQMPDGLYSLSNRRLFVFRVVANYTYGEVVCKATLYPFNHQRVRELRWCDRTGSYETKWTRAFSSTCRGAWVHVQSEYRWKQEAPPAYEYFAERKGLWCIPEGEEVPEAMAGAQCEVLFEVPWGDLYPMELARLCKEYGVSETSPDCVLSASGKEFTLIFYEQPQVVPDAEKTDFPLSVWRTRGIVDSASVEAEMIDPGAGKAAASDEQEVPEAMASDGQEQEVKDGEEDGQEQEQGLHEQQVEEALHEEPSTEYDSGYEASIGETDYDLGKKEQGLPEQKVREAMASDGQEDEVGEASQEEQIALPKIATHRAAMQDPAPVTPSTASPCSTQYDSEYDTNIAESDYDLGPVDKIAKQKWKRWNKIPNQNCDHPKRWNKMAK